MLKKLRSDYMHSVKNSMWLCGIAVRRVVYNMRINHSSFTQSPQITSKLFSMYYFYTRFNRFIHPILHTVFEYISSVKFTFYTSSTTPTITTTYNK